VRPGVGWSFSGSASGIISRETVAMASIAHCQPAPAMPSATTGTTRNCPKEDPAVPSPTARPRMVSGSSRVRLAMMTGMPAAETAQPMTTPAKKVNSPSPSDSAMPTSATTCSAAPIMMTRRPPMRSATWPQIGWVMPLTSTCRAMAKAKPLALQACAVVIGARNRPRLWRSPIASAAVMTAQPSSSQTARRAVRPACPATEAVGPGMAGSSQRSVRHVSIAGQPGTTAQDAWRHGTRMLVGQDIGA
jgi:hypothetical protein